MAKAIDVAKFLIEIVGSSTSEDAITNLRINKLLYFAQAHSLQSLGYFLIDDDFQAWRHGPVIPSIYRIYKKFGKNAIQEELFDWSSLTRKEQLYLLDIIRKYKNDSTSALEAKSHTKGSPWDKSYELSVGQVIPKEEIEAYFKNEPKVKSFSPNYEEEDYIGYRDDSVALVIPMDSSYAK